MGHFRKCKQYMSKVFITPLPRGHKIFMHAKYFQNYVNVVKDGLKTVKHKLLRESGTEGFT